MKNMKTIKHEDYLMYYLDKYEPMLYVDTLLYNC